MVTANSVDRERRPCGSSAAGRAVSVELDAGLLPGEFALDVGVHHRNGTTIDYVQGALRFTALNASERGDDHYPWNAVRGYVRPHAVWSEVTDPEAAPAVNRPGG